MARKYANRVWMTTTTAGTGTITLGSVKSGDYFTFAEAGVSNGDTVAYVIVDGSNVEIGIGTYTSSGTTLSRDTVIASRIAGVAGTTKVTLSGNATVFIAEQATEAQAVYDLLENLAANSVLARAASSAGAPSGVALSASQLLGRGSTGDVAAVTLGGGLKFDGTTLNAPQLLAVGTATGTTATDITNLPSGFTSWLLRVNWTGTNSASVLNIALSSDNGSSYGSSRIIASSGTAGNLTLGSVQISDVSNSSTNKTITPAMMKTTDMDAAVATTTYTTTATETVITGVINALRVVGSGNTSQACSFELWGIP